MAEIILPGGNIGGAVRVGDTVRRPTGPWTPAVHALLAHLAGRLPHVPRVHGLDERGREVLDFLPGEVVDLTRSRLTEARLASLVRWTQALHAAVAEFAHPGPWRAFPLPPGATPTLVGHNDLGAYNLCFDGDDLAGVFDWDLAGPTTPLLELAFVAWNGVPLWSPDVEPDDAARRLRLIASTYAGGSRVDDGLSARAVLRAVPPRIAAMMRGILDGAAAGDAGLARLVAGHEQDLDRAALASLAGRVPAIDAALG